jgi:hypothetical protein
MSSKPEWIALMRAALNVNSDVELTLGFRFQDMTPMAVIGCPDQVRKA